jgi:hypothetical protein
MSQHVEAARHAWRLWNDETVVGSIAALVLVAVFFGPVLRRVWRYHRATR